MTPTDARNMANQLAAMKVQSLSIGGYTMPGIELDPSDRDEIVTNIRALADQLEYTMRTAEAYKKGLGYARGNFLKLKEDADDFATYAGNTLRDGGGR